MLFLGAVSRDRAVIASTLFLLIAALSQQLYHAFTFIDSLQSKKEQESIEVYIGKNAVPPKNKLDNGFGACLMLKEDNDLLTEWLAYHYTVLPLRYLVVGSDIGNTQDPTSILESWEQTTNLQYTLLQVADIFNATSIKPSNKDDERERAHHAFVSRQKALVMACSKFLKEKGVHWSVYIDNDEFVVMNRLGQDDKGMKMDETAHQIRKELPPVDSNATILDVIKHLEQTNRIGPCYTMPRLLIGALENVSCPDALSVNEFARKRYSYQSMSTLRFVQHARKGDFASSKFGKVMMDLSKLTKETLDSVPRNIHRPYKSHCGPGVVHFPNAFIYLNHYIGNWERYSSRLDGRRNRDEWEARAYFNHGALCDKAVHTWLPRFIALVGEERAKSLLVNDNGGTH